MTCYEDYILKNMKIDLQKETSHLKHPRCIDLALEFAFVAHSGQRRASGEFFIHHPFNVAMILAKNKMDSSSIVAGLLHDCVEDTTVSLEEVQKFFGGEVKSLVEGVTKVTKLKSVHFVSRDEEHAENMRSLFVSMANDWRVILIKLSDRLHNMQTLQYLPLHKQMQIASRNLGNFRAYSAQIWIVVLQVRARRFVVQILECRVLQGDTKLCRRATRFFGNIFEFYSANAPRSVEHIRCGYYVSYQMYALHTHEDVETRIDFGGNPRHFRFTHHCQR